ncbi:hypothetical protein MAR_005491 [Mya arenaria]|uniref:Uncharacterized protein n=1 Tax=Mya arenaria TaxID=6604 RepID=A0ABY7F7X0_MYAAR|nr:hypothetical protein MAR_005491 [Mya arenaria]
MERTDGQTDESSKAGKMNGIDTEGTADMRGEGTNSLPCPPLKMIRAGDQNTGDAQQRGGIEVKQTPKNNYRRGGKYLKNRNRLLEFQTNMEDYALLVCLDFQFEKNHKSHFAIVLSIVCYRNHVFLYELINENPDEVFMF